MILRRFLNAFSLYRPRVLTILLVAAIGALLVLANLSDEPRGRIGPMPANGGAGLASMSANRRKTAHHLQICGTCHMVGRWRGANMSFFVMAADEAGLFGLASRSLSRQVCGCHQVQFQIASLGEVGEVCRERHLWRFGKNVATSIGDSRNATEGVPYRGGASDAE